MATTEESKKLSPLIRQYLVMIGLSCQVWPVSYHSIPKEVIKLLKEHHLLQTLASGHISRKPFKLSFTGYQYYNLILEPFIAGQHADDYKISKAEDLPAPAFQWLCQLGGTCLRSYPIYAQELPAGILQLFTQYGLISYYQHFKGPSVELSVLGRKLYNKVLAEQTRQGIRARIIECNRRASKERIEQFVQEAIRETSLIAELENWPNKVGKNSNG